MAQLVVKSATPADGTFSATGTTVWNAGMGPTSGQLTAAFGGTGLDGSAAANGTIPIGNGAGFTLANIAAGSNVTVTNGSGTITIAASSGTNSGPTFPGGIPLTGVSYPSIGNTGKNISTGDTDLYTVPANKRAMVMSYAVYNNSGVGNIAWFPQIKIAGTYQRILTNISTANGAATANIVIGYIAEAGEIIAINTATNNGLNVWLKMVVFDNTCAVKSAKIQSFVASDNTVYTCPASTTAFLLDSSFLTNLTAPTFAYANTTGGAVTVVWNVVPSGQSVGTSNQINASSSKSNNTRTDTTGNSNMSAGDFVSINTSVNTAGQMAWVNVMEIT